MSISVAAIDTALERFGIERTAEPAPVADSILNQNFRIESRDRVYFLRFAQLKREKAVVEAEHRAMRHAAESGVPVPLPCASLGGDSVIEIEGQRAAVYPFVEGRTARRGAITPGEAAALGAMQGRLCGVLANFRDDVLEARHAGETLWDTAASVNTLYRIEAWLSAHLTGIDERHARRAARMQLMLLESGQARPSGDFAHLPVQIDHGDFHERNVILDADSDRVLAVVDWERVRVLPRAFQLVRAIDFIGLLVGGPLDEYLAAFGREQRLEPQECHDAVDQWWQSALHNTWTYTETFEAGNVAVARFLPEMEGRLQRLANESFRRQLGERIARHTAG